TRWDRRSDRARRALRLRDDAVLQHAIGDGRPLRDRVRALVRDDDGHGERRAGERGLRHLRIDPRHVEVAGHGRGLRLAAEPLEHVVDAVARARRLTAVLAQDVVAVAVALDVRRIAHDVDPRAVRRLLLMLEGVVAVRLYPVLGGLHRDDVRDRALQLTRGLRDGVVAERGDADRAIVPSVRVT